ncbi:MAG: Stk1 family PASTA domain-containing Ser/Thr kinase [Clostridia bacterium]
MATVYKAKCHVLNRLVAVKVLKEEFTTDEEFIRRFNIEAQSAAGLTHPNIVSIYDVGHEDNIYYIVMELVQGKTLKEIIAEDGSLPWKWSVNIAIQIASALEAAHKNNIVHRDIKPHNIIITEEGVAKVTDFGIAKAVSNSTITAFGTTIGSVHYFSPEHARGGYTDAKSDLYSLGVVMYEMLTGRVPFDADTPVSIALKHMQEKPVEPMKLNPSIPLAVNQIIIKAMQKEPALRYQSATEMLRDLTMALKNPEGDFVAQAQIDTSSTQRIGTITEDMLEKNKETRSTEKKKKGKLAQYFKEHPKMKIAAIVLSFILVFIITVFTVKTIMDVTTVKNVPIPELVGKTEEEIKEVLKGTKLQYEITGEDYSSEIEEGKIISQDPSYRKNFTIKENTTIKLVVSKGIEVVTIPKVAGYTYEEAEKILTDAKLKVEKIEETSQKVQEGVVIKQEPAENTSANAGDTIKVHVSTGTGIKQVAVPSLVNKTQEAASKELTDNNLKVSVAYEEDTTKENGIVLKQSIDTGKVVDEGTTVTITVNKIAEIKKGTVNINLKSLLNYTKPTNTNSTDTEVPKVEVMVKVGEDTVYKEKQAKDTTKITVPVSGKGVITVKVYVDEVLKTTQNLDLNSKTVLDIE